MQRQPGDEPRPVFSFLGRREDHPAQVHCHITATNERTHAIIRGATDRSPMFTGLIEGIGPRYCPSVEDKVVRFAAKSSHQIFVEPEGLDTHDRLPERHLDQPAGRRADSRSCARSAASSGPRSPARATRSSTTISIRATCAPAWRPSRSPGSSSPARSMARRATRKRPHRGCSPASTRHAPQPAWAPGRRAATRPISACWWTT